MTRQQALAAHLNKYQGKPCPYGHPGIRYTINKNCIDCIAEKERARWRRRKAAA